jgi:RNA polymerase sigma-70 factor (ECF subfamily)
MSSPRLVDPESRGARLVERTDDELMTLSQAGAREAFAVLVERHALRVVETCSRFAGDRQAGVELAQETWAAIWEQRFRYRAGSVFVVWLITVARNRCRNALRGGHVARRHATETLALGAAPSPDQIDRLLVEERRCHVREALGKLPSATREALLLRFGEELRYDQMAEVVGAGESTLRSRVHHGLKRLRDLLGGSP